MVVRHQRLLHKKRQECFAAVPGWFWCDRVATVNVLTQQSNRY